MPKCRISTFQLASPLLVLRGGWEAGIMNKHTPIMDNNYPPSCTARKRVRPDDDSDVEEQNTPDWSVRMVQVHCNGVT